MIIFRTLQFYAGKRMHNLYCFTPMETTFENIRLLG